MKNISKLIVAALLALTFAFSAQPAFAGGNVPSNNQINGMIGDPV